MLSFFWKFWQKPSFIVGSVTSIALIFGIIDGIKVAGFGDYLPEFLQHLPLNEQNLAWLIPSLVVLAITVIIDKVKFKNI